MRFVVFLDLFATLVTPASVAYLGYLIYQIVLDPQKNMTAVYLIAATYSMQALIFLIKRQWQHVGWSAYLS
jgi:chitin synthase